MMKPKAIFFLAFILVSLNINSRLSAQGSVLRITVFDADMTSKPMGWALNSEDEFFIEKIKKSRIEYGSGFLYKAQNGGTYILTNAHVVDAGLGDKGEIVAFLDGDKYPLSWVGGDTYYDLAVLKFDHNISPRAVRYFPFNVSSLSSSRRISALANRGGKDNYRCDGQITQLDRILTGISGGGGYIEHTAILVEGCSGGPLLDENGAIIGMNTRVDTESRLGYALPIRKIIRLAESIIQNNGRVERVYLGLEFQQKIKRDHTQKVISPLERPQVKHILSNSPLKGKIREKDYIKSIDGKQVTTLRDVFKILENLKPGKTFEMVVTNDPLGESNWRNIPVVGKKLSSNNLEEIAQSYLKTHLQLASGLSENGLSIKGVLQSSEILLARENGDYQAVSLKIVSSQPAETGNDFRLYRVQNFVDFGIMLRLCSLDGRIKLFCRDENQNLKIVTTIWSSEGKVSALYY